jgi:hypothetical protein
VTTFSPWYKRGTLVLPGDHRSPPTLDGVTIPEVYSIDYHAEVNAVPEIVFRLRGPGGEFEGMADVLVLGERLADGVVALLEQVLQLPALAEKAAWRTAAEQLIGEILKLQAVAKLGPPGADPGERPPTLEQMESGK